LDFFESPAFQLLNKIVIEAFLHD